MSDITSGNAQINVINGTHSVLFRESVLISFIGWSILVSGSILLRFNLGWAAVIQWFIQAGLIWWFAIYQTRIRLDQNRMNPESPLYPDLGWGNRLTILRGLFIAAVGGFLFQELPATSLAWLPGILYFFAAIIDRLDGYVARRTRQTSLLGIELDTVVDALGIAVVSLLAVWYGQIHWSYLLLGSAYYLFQFGIYRRRRRGLPVFPLSPGIYRRAWAGFQMGFLVVVLLPLFQPPVTTVAGIAFMLPALSGFIIDWLVVSGRVNRQATAVVQVFDRLQRITQYVLLPLFRIAVSVVLIYLVSQSGYTIIPIEETTPSQILITYGFMLTAIMILTGIAVRFTAIVLIVMLGWFYLSYPTGLIDYLLIFSLTWLMLFGSGHYSLWQIDSDWINRYDGA